MTGVGDRGPGDARVLPPPPPLPPGLVDVRPILAIGTVCWFVACCVLLLTGHHGVWMWSCVAGWVLGLIGFLIVWWQRSASRRGSRSAQRGL